MVNNKNNKNNDGGAKSELLLQQQELFEAMEQKLLSSFEKRFNEILSRFEEKIDKAQETAERAHQRTVDNESKIDKISAEFKAVKEKMDQQQQTLLKALDVQSVKIATLEARLEHQTNRNSRKSVIIRGVPEHQDEKTWDDCRKVVCEKLAEITHCDPETLSNSIERIHRGKPNRHDGPRVVHALFFDWNDSEHLISSMRKHGRSSRIYVEQRYGPDTTWRRNSALTLRKDLKAQGTITSGFIAYPAKLMVKYNVQDRKYTMHQDFSNAVVPITRSTPNNNSAA